MVYKRLELHNHTTESDGNITAEQLLHHMCTDLVDGFALTDHNTISGHRKIKQLLEEKNFPIQCIYGMEYTTYYGHILCLNLTEYVPWETINLHKPELLFQAVKEKGALVGIAHPFSFGHPFARGCRFDMTITDYSSFDYIEIINNSESLTQANKQAILWWESLVLKGYNIAITSGMDLHNSSSMQGCFATFIKGENGSNIQKELEQAIHANHTYVSKGAILEVTANKQAEELVCSIIPTNKPGFNMSREDHYYMTLKTPKEILSIPFETTTSFTIPYHKLQGETIVIPKLYKNGTELEQLIAISPALFL